MEEQKFGIAPAWSIPCVLPSLSSPFQVVAPTISSPVCQEQLIEAGKLVAKSAEGCVEASKAATSDDQLLKQVGVAATAVTQALNDLLQHIKQHALGGQPIGRYDQATDTILNVTENIFSSMGDAGESETPGQSTMDREVSESPWDLLTGHTSILFQGKWCVRLVFWPRPPLTLSMPSKLMLREKQTWRIHASF